MDWNSLSIKNSIKEWIKSWKHCARCEDMVKEHLMYNDYTCNTCAMYDDTNKQGDNNE